MATAIGERGLIQRARRSLAGIIDDTADNGDADRAALPVVAAYSGGADSLALVVVLRELERLGLVRLVAVHVDHGVRAESAEEAEQVAEVVARLGVAFRTCRIEPGALASHRGVGLEEAMRRERYRLLASTAQNVDAKVIATGHHRRDQAETVLLHLLRGAGLSGAAGIREAASIVVPWWGDDPSAEITLWRPLLGESPETLRSLVSSLDLPVIEDASNAADAFRRNALRHQALPVLEAIVPGAEANLAAFARRAADDDAALEAIAEIRLGTPSYRLDRSTLLGQPEAIRRRMVRRWIAVLAPEVEFTAERTESILLLVDRNEGGKQVEIGAGWRITLRDGVLTLDKA